MEKWLRQRLWVLDLAATGLCALFLARAATLWVEGRLATLPAPPQPTRGVSRYLTAARDKDTERIVARNIFCSACPSAFGETPPPTPRDPSPHRSHLPLRLVAINVAVAPWSVRHSSAILRDLESQRVGAFALHDRVRGAVVERIEATRVEIDNQGQREFLDLLEGATEREPAPGEPAPASARAPRDALTEALERGVRKLGPRSYEIDRSALEAALADPGALSLSARAVPESRDGRPVGLRFISVRPGGPAARLGLESGDLIFSVNGLELTSPEQGLTAYTKLRSVNHVELGLERAGRRLSQEYRVR